MNPYFRLVRIHNVLGAAFGAFTGYVVGAGWEIRPLSLVEALLVVSLVAAGGYSINDVYDLEIDRINKPDRPLPSGAISLRRATYLSYSLMGLGVMIAVIQGGAQAAVALLTATALVLYARDLKKTGFYGNLLVATTTALSIFYGGISYGSGTWLDKIWIPVVYTFLLTLSREVIKGIEDYRGDLIHGVRTVATRMGVERAWTIARASLISTSLISPLPLLLGFNLLYGVLLVPFLYFTARAITAETSEQGASKARALLKGSAFIGMLAFSLGSLPLSLLHL